jgi:hypothetical protein
MFIIAILMIPSAILLFEPYGQGVFYIVFVFLMLIIAYYIYGGLAKLITYLVYFMVTLLALISLNESYQVFVSLVATFAIIVHPLQSIETKLEKKMSKEFTNQILLSMRGSYWPYFQYREDMKAFYHLPQHKKLKQQKKYLLLRQFTTLLFLFIGTFIFINQTSSVLNDLENFSWIAFFDIYIVLWMYLMSYYAFKKGFTTVFRSFILGMLPFIQYIIYQTYFDTWIKIVLSIIFGLFSLGIIIYEAITYFQRVSFDSYAYEDEGLHLKVYANALFEPLVYNDTYITSVTYRLRISLDTFHKHFHQILVFANFHKILITAYAYGEQMLYVFADFHYRDRKKVDLFKTFMESKFIMAIPYQLETDKHKNLYEKNFFHRLPYIIARGKHLAQLLKAISNETLIVVSMIMYFESYKDVENFKKSYQIVMLSDIYVADYFAIKVDLPLINNDYVISQEITKLHQTMVLSQGTFVRILVSKLNI